MQQLKPIEEWLAVQSRQPKEKSAETKNHLALLNGADENAKSAVQKLATTYGRKLVAVNLAGTVSKFTGETEKNLAAVFQRAEAAGAVLFFDEAETLFEKRTGVKDAHDRYANQEVASLLQRMETYPGLVILASSRKADIDPVLLQRFRTVL